MVCNALISSGSPLSIGAFCTYKQSNLADAMGFAKAGLDNNAITFLINFNAPVLCNDLNMAMGASCCNFNTITTSIEY